MFHSPLQRALSAAALVAVTNAIGITSVVCNVSSLHWSFNNEGVSPCQVAANLGAVCSSTGDYTIPVLAPPVSENFYTPSLEPTPCECSTVVYNLAAACGLCQGGLATTWLFWQTNCTAISPAIFPFNLPPDTDVPHWAYLDPRSTNKFDPTAASAAGDAPESTATATSTIPNPGGPVTGGGITTTGFGFPPTTSSPQSNGGSSSGGGSSTNAGAIAGGVVGGVIALGIIGGLLFFFMRKGSNKNQNAPSTVQQPYEEKPFMNGGYPTSPLPDQTSQFAQASHSTHQRPYDPNDPSTFPGSPQSFGGSTIPQSMAQYSPSPMQSAVYGSDHPSQHGSAMTPLGARPGGYSGVAEL